MTSSVQSVAASQGVQNMPPPSFDAIYTQECSYVWNCLRRLGVQSRDLEDLVHDCFVVANRRMVDFDPSRPVRPWLYGIALRVASDYRKSARNRREVLSAEPPEAEAQPSRPDEEMSAGQNRALVMAALDSLAFKNRVIFVMHDINEHTMAEAAEELELPMATLYSRLKVAREQFGSAVQRLRLQGGEA
jgi:RNA polymerase sigma-70 factor (ECF subfamily)